MILNIFNFRGVIMTPNNNYTTNMDVVSTRMRMRHYG